jgi:protein involved in plasmid replication-relaxation
MTGMRRLRRFTREAATALPRFRITERDTEILAAALQYRILTTEQIARLFFPARAGGEHSVSSLCRNRLKLLFHHGLLFREELDHKRPDGSRPTVYLLDREGAEHLAALYGCDLRSLGWSADQKKVKSYFIEHTIATNDSRISITLSAQRHGFHLLRWIDEQTLRRSSMKDVVTIESPDGRSERSAIVPDGYFLLHPGGDEVYHCFLEIDLATETGQAAQWSHRDFARKIISYLAYYKSGLYTKRYKAQGGRVLIITTSQQRLANLRQVVERTGGRNRFWLTTLAACRTADPLTDAIWEVATREGHFALIEERR